MIWILPHFFLQVVFFPKRVVSKEFLPGLFHRCSFTFTHSTFPPCPIIWRPWTGRCFLENHPKIGWFGPPKTLNIATEKFTNPSSGLASWKRGNLTLSFGQGIYFPHILLAWYCWWIGSIPLFTRFGTPQVVVWDFWTINSMFKPTKEIESQNGSMNQRRQSTKPNKKKAWWMTFFLSPILFDAFVFFAFAVFHTAPVEYLPLYVFVNICALQVPDIQKEMNACKKKTKITWNVQFSPQISRSNTMATIGASQVLQHSIPFVRLSWKGSTGSWSQHVTYRCIFYIILMINIHRYPFSSLICMWYGCHVFFDLLYIFTLSQIVFGSGVAHAWHTRMGKPPCNFTKLDFPFGQVMKPFQKSHFSK